MKTRAKMISIKAIVTILLGILPVAITAAATPGANADIPFAMLSPEAVLNSPKKVFAHYFYPLPLSLDNLPSTKDYYAVQYLNPHGENDKFIKQGGMLRVRPLPVSPKSGANWQVHNMQQEVRMAIARGINGFAFDIMSTAEAATGGKLLMMLEAAQAVDPRFKIVLMPDMTGLGTNTDNVATIVKAVYRHPSLFHWTDGRLVLAPFATETVSPGKWSAMLDQLKSQGIDSAFIPTFGSLQQTFVDQYDDISVGLGNFGNPGTPEQLEWTLICAARVRASKAPILFAGITPQNYRPKDFNYDEACNSLAYRNAWAGAIQSKADMIQIVTWNDFGESTNVAPATSQYGDSGTGFYDLTGYYATWFHTGKEPVITRDVLYYFYRKEPHDAAAPAQAKPMTTAFPQTPQNQIELLAFLKSPGTMAITIGGKTLTKTAPAGVTSFTVPSAPGIPQFELTRHHASVIKFQGRTRIYGVDGLPSGYLDLTYWSGSAAAGGNPPLTVQAVNVGTKTDPDNGQEGVIPSHAPAAHTSSATTQRTTLTVNGAQQFQNIDGFGVNIHTESWNDGEVKPALDLLVDRLGATLFRAAIEEMDWETPNDDDAPNHFNWTYYNSVYSNAKFQKVWNTLRYLNQKGIDKGLILSFMGKPPDWMGGQTTVSAANEDEFVETMASLLYYARHTAGIRFTLVSPINEPDTGGVEGPNMDAAQNARILHKLAVKLDAIGLNDIRLVGPDVAGNFQVFFDEIVKEPVIMAKLAHWDVHLYGHDASGIQNLISKSAYPKVNFWVTESAEFQQILSSHLAYHPTADLVWDGFDAVYHHAIRAGRGATAPNDSPGIDPPLIAYNAATHRYTPRRSFWESAQLFKFVAPGARRIGMTATGDKLFVHAFRNPNGQLVIVGRNNGDDTTLTCNLTNLQAVSTFEIYRTNAKMNLQRGTDVSVTRGTFSFAIAAGTTFTLASATASPPPVSSGADADGEAWLRRARQR